MRRGVLRVIRVVVVVALVAAAVWAGLRTWEEQHRYPHSRDAYVRANVVGIAAQIDGPITELFVKDNQPVRKGEILFRIERGPYEAVVARAAGKVGRAEAEVFNTRQILQRSERLARDQFVSREKLDSDLAAVRSAEAELELARAELWAAELNLSYTEVPAPADGSVTNFLVRVGTYVKRGQELFALVEDRTWWVTANFMETYLRDIRPGQRVSQGTVIGYVGSTGLSTGPNLHYEFRVNGAHRNPLSMMLPPPAPLSGTLLAQFRGETKRALGKIREVENIVFQGEDEPKLAKYDEGAKAKRDKRG